MLNPATPAATGSPIVQYLKLLQGRYRVLQEGRVADYIPELANADPNWFGISIATRDGHVYDIGDTRQPFTIQSISKTLAYGLALEDRGEEFILSRISVEPSGDAFNAISLKAGSGAPFNPMINAGAIATCSQVLVRDGRSRFERILAYISACAGRKLDVDEAVYRSESETGHRNRAIGWMLRNFGIIEEDPTEILETYFRQCAIRVNCRDLAVIAATLANQGRNPLTGEQAIAPEYVDNILSVMASCGMYDFSGEWIYRVGLPAKSGVGGGIMAVLPGQLGIGTFSPPLDAQGNSARGIKVCADMARELALHQFSNMTQPAAAIRLGYDGGQVSSRRIRQPEAAKALRGRGHRIRVFELQGELRFSGFESVVRTALKQAPYCQFVILDFRKVTSIDAVAFSLLARLAETLAGQGVQLHLCAVGKLFAECRDRASLRASVHDDADAALETCENELLKELLGPAWDASAAVALGGTQLLCKLDADDLAWLDGALHSREAAAGEALIRAGDIGDSLYILLAGTVEIRLPSADGTAGRRVGTYAPGMSFGEMGLLDGSPRSADVVALTAASYRVLDRTLFDRLDAERPQLKIRLLAQLARIISGNLRKANREMATFKG